MPLELTDTNVKRMFHVCVSISIMVLLCISNGFETNKTSNLSISVKANKVEQLPKYPFGAIGRKAEGL